MTLSENALSFRTAFFFAHDLPRPDKVFRDIGDTITEFDQMPNMQPLPVGLQSNSIPLITFRSNSGIFLCEISQSRLDFFVQLGQQFGTFKFDAIYNEYKRISLDIAKYIAAVSTTPIIRVGVVGEVFIPTENMNKGVQLIQKIKKMPIESDLVELGCRSNKQHEIIGIMCNDILAIETGQLQGSSGLTPGVVVNKDLNNIPKSAFDEMSLTRTMSSLLEHLDQNSFARVVNVE